MRLLAETTGNFQLLYAEMEELVRHTGLTVITKSQWAGEYVAGGQIKIEAQVSDEATDAEWLETLRECDGDQELAVASFVERFPVTVESVKAAEPAPPAKSSTQQQKHNSRQAGSHAPKPK